MKRVSSSLVVWGVVSFLGSSAFGATIYNNLTPSNLMGIATRPGTGAFEIEAGDDFFLGSQTLITSATFDGLIVAGPGTVAAPSTISDVVAEMYNIFPVDSNTARTPNVPTRANSPSDNAFASKDSAANELTFTSSVISNSPLRFSTACNRAESIRVPVKPPWAMAR